MKRAKTSVTWAGWRGGMLAVAVRTPFGGTASVPPYARGDKLRRDSKVVASA